MRAIFYRSLDTLLRSGSILFDGCAAEAWKRVSPIFLKHVIVERQQCATFVSDLKRPHETPYESCDGEAAIDLRELQSASNESS
jgi:hypothetical protein